MFENINWGGLVGFLLVLGASIAGVIKGIREARNSNEAARKKIEKAESKLEKEPEKAKPAWDLARATLESYFNRNLAQITSIFWLSVVVMIVGFCILPWGISMSLRSPTIVVPAAIASMRGS